MSKIITVPFTENFLSHVVDYIGRYYESGRDLSRMGVVFGGRRPSLFIKRDLATLIGKAFVSPRFFTIDDWMAYVALGGHQPQTASDLDYAYIIYQLVQELCPSLSQGRESFAQFLPWAMEISNFIEQLDLEDVPYEKVNQLKEHAKIGLSIPEDINKLLMHIGALRKAYHQQLQEMALMPRGFQYLRACQRVQTCSLEDFDEILFCNFFYLHETESKVIKNIYDRASTVLFMQGDQRRWPALKRIAQVFGSDILEGPQIAPRHFDLKIYEAFDTHAQAGLVDEILKRLPPLDATVIVLPDSDFLVTLLTAIGHQLEAFNVSMGYPLKRSALYTLLSLMIEAQNRRKDGLYYAKDYLNIVQHPLVKSLGLGDPFFCGVFSTKIEAALAGEVLTDLSGRLFLDLEAIVGDERFLNWVGRENIKDKIELIHKVFLKSFDHVRCAVDLSRALDGFLDFMQGESVINRYPLNAPIAHNLREIAEEFSCCRFAKEHFEARDLFRIFKERLSNQMVAFSGSPLRGLQILGLFETRALNFTNVIVVDVNEGCLPSLNIYQPLIPREVMVLLDLHRVELEEEIQRYGFMRLISSAREVHLIYQQNNNQKPKSRFLEELIWEKEKQQGAIGNVDIVLGSFEVSVQHTLRSVAKTKAMVDYLKDFKFSPSSINTYLDNPYSFYCQYVLGLKPKDDWLQGPQSRSVGIFMHDLMQEAFKVFIGRKPVIDDHFRKYFQKIYETRFDATFGRTGGRDTFLMETVLKTRLERFLMLEQLRCELHVKKVLFIEKKFEDVLPLGGEGVHWTYRIDRVDEMMDGSILVLDYKTGGVDLKPGDLSKEVPWSREYLYHCVKSFQMPLYLHYVRRQYPHTFVNCAFYYLRTMKMDFFLNQNQMKDTAPMIASYEKALDFIMTEIFNPEIPFVDH